MFALSTIDTPALLGEAGRLACPQSVDPRRFAGRQEMGLSFLIPFFSLTRSLFRSLYDVPINLAMDVSLTSFFRRSGLQAHSKPRVGKCEAIRSTDPPRLVYAHTRA
jgi:hypothetical protein